MSGLKRPRDDDLDLPRIRYIVTEHDRAFERLLKEDSYEELREAIHAKLGLKPTAKIQMYRVHGDLKFDLEDENDFAAMKSAAYASDAFAIHVTYAYKRPPRSRAARNAPHVSIVLPDEAEDHEKEVTAGSPAAEDNRPAKKSTAKSKEVIDNSDVDALSENEAEPPQAKKARPKPQQAAKETPPVNSKRKATPNSDDEEDPSEKEVEPPKKKQKSDKPSKEKAKSSKASTKEQPKSSTGKSKKTSATTQSNKSPEAVEKASRATTNAQEEDRVPPTKKSKSSKKDDESTSTFKSISKPVSKPVKPSKVAVEITSMLPVLNHSTKPKDRVTENPKSAGYETDNSEDTTTDQSSIEMNSTSKSKTDSKNQQGSANRKGNRDDPKPVSLPTQVVGKKKDGKKVAESETSKKSGKPAEDLNDKAKDKKAPADAAKNKAKDKKVISSAQTPSFKEPAVVSSLAKSSSASSMWPNEQSIDTLVTELEGTIGSKNANTNGVQSQKIATSKAPQSDYLQGSNVPVLPRKSKLSHVTVQSHDEGSESDSTSSSSGSNSDGEDVVPNRNSSLAKTTPSLESESSRQSMNLDAVNLDELIRGPSASAKSVVASLSMLEEEDNSQLDKEETEEEEELEEEEEVETKHSVIPETARRLSTAASQVVDDDSESDSSTPPSPPPNRPSSRVILERGINHKVISGSTSEENNEEKETPASTSPSPAPLVAEPVPVSDKTNPVTDQSTSEGVTSAMEVEISTNLDESRTDTNESNPSVHPRVPTPPANNPTPSHALVPTTPLKRATPVVEATPKTPRTIQRMKDKEGRLPAPSTPTASVTRTIVSAGPDPLPKITRGIVEEEEEEEEEEEAISDVGQSTVRATRTMTTRSRPTRGVSKEPSAPPPSTRRTRQSSVVPVPEQRVLRSSRAPSTPIKATTAKGKRKPTKKIMESESEFDLDKEDTATVVPRTTTGESAVLGSQWQVLPPLPPTLPTSPSSQIDELQSNVTSQRVRIKSPELTAGSRRMDENDVEELIGSSDTPKASRSPLRSPLFLPGASQLSPSQYPIGLMDLDDGALQAEAEARSEAESELESDKELSMPQQSQPFKSIFPSLSELSFNKFRPSFLMKNQSQGTKPQDSSKALKKVEESDSDSEDDDDEDDDSSGSEEKVSHIPKNKRAGAGVVKKRKSKGLLQ